jgi:hypothetical protein
MKVSKAIVIGCAVAGLVFSSFAAEQAAAPAAKTAPAKIALSKLQGSIESIDAIGNMVIVKTKTASETLKVEPTTKITIGGKTAAIADLKAGTMVSVSYKDDNGTKVAVSIKEKVAAAKAAKPAPTAPATK